jgi:sugar phosphate isomerase/epimerase
VALTAPLNPTARVLHLPLDGPARDPMEITCWRQRLEKSVDAIIQNGIPGHTFSVENLNYPMEWIRPIIERFDMAICLDMGHLLDRGINWRPEYQKWKNRINMIHLHGVRDGQDHCALDALSPAVFTPILAALTSFKETVSIEVFSFKNLKKSLVYLEKYRQNSA